MQKIYAPRLTDTLPQSILNDEELKAAAEALDLELEKLSADIEQVLHLPRLDILNHDILNHLAYSFHVDFFEPTSMDLETKRQLVRESIYQHRIKGTPYALEKLVETVFKSAKIEEWFEYDENKPYYFRITSKGLFDNGDESGTLFRLIDSVKNVRSWLDDLLFDLTFEGVDTSIYYGMTSQIGGEVLHDTEPPHTQPNYFYLGTTEIQAGLIENDWQPENIIDDFPAFIGVVRVDLGTIEFDWQPENIENSFADFYGVVEIEASYIEFASGESSDDWIFDDEDFEPPIETDYLRLFFKFPEKKLRTVTLLNPRDDVDAFDVNNISEMAVRNKLLHSSTGFATLGIYKAWLVKQYEKRIY